MLKFRPSPSCERTAVGKVATGWTAGRGSVIFMLAGSLAVVIPTSALAGAVGGKPKGQHPAGSPAPHAPAKPKGGHPGDPPPHSPAKPPTHTTHPGGSRNHSSPQGDRPAANPTGGSHRRRAARPPVAGPPTHRGKPGRSHGGGSGEAESSGSGCSLTGCGRAPEPPESAASEPYDPTSVGVAEPPDGGGAERDRQSDSAVAPESTGSTAVETVSSAAPRDGGDSALASLPFTGLALLGLVLVGSALAGLGALVRRLARLRDA